MLAAFFLTIVLAAPSTADGPSPADGLRLGPEPEPPPSSAVPLPPPSPVPVAPVSPWKAFAGLGVAAAAAVGWIRRREGAGSRTGEGVAVPPAPPPDDPIVVFVGGHGSDLAVPFQELIAALRLPAERVRHFDYRWARPSRDHASATEHVGIADAAGALTAYLTGLGEDEPVYLVGHSKGGAVIASLVAGWDGDPASKPPGVVGAALLEAPLSGGFLGFLQSAGTIFGPLPEDGGYDPVVCDPDCRDSRHHLGAASGVEVVVVRNPDAWLTSFGDDPPGLRVYDLHDSGLHAAWFVLAPVFMPFRVRSAHNSVLHSSEVAGLIGAELALPGSGTLTQPSLRRAAAPPGRTLVE